MRRKVLFIISNLETGGVSKSMTSLMNVIDRNRYDVALMIVSPHGAFMDLLPNDVRILTNPVWDALTDRINGIGKLIKLKHPLLAIGHSLRLVVSMFSKAKAGELIATLMPPINEDFDTIIDYNGQQQLYYMVNKLKARKKLSFFHSDYKKWSYYYSADKKYFKKVDSVWTISKTCAKSLMDVFPEIKKNINVMENITSLSLISTLAEEINVSDEIRSDIPTIISIGHVCEGKGSHWAIEAASLMKKHGLSFIWYFLGANPDNEYYDRLCAKFDVKDRIVFLGIKANPYPYIKAATIVVHPSQYEGKSIALDEAKLLCKPIVVTDFSTVHDQFTDGYNASICKMKPTSIATAVEDLLNDAEMRNIYVKNLNADRKDNSDEIIKLYDVIDE